MKFSEYIKTLTESELKFTDSATPERIVDALVSKIETLKTIPNEIKSLFKMSKDNLEIKSFPDAIDFLRDRSLSDGLEQTVTEFDFFTGDDRSELDPKSKSPVVFKKSSGYLNNSCFNGKYIQDLPFFKEILEDLKQNKEQSKFFGILSKIVKPSEVAGH